jgi:hypothetical protein
VQRSVLVLLLLVALAGCPRKEEPVADAAPPPATAAIVQPRAVFDAGANAPASAALAVLHAWNAANNAHDDKALGALYDDPVELYGTPVTRDVALQRKRAAFATHLRDDLDAIEVTGEDRVRFHKKSTSKGGAAIDVLGYLELVRRGSALRIRAEGDSTTDSNIARAKESRCEAAVGAAALSTKEAQAAEADIARGATEMADVEEVHVAGMTLPPSSAGAPWVVRVCESHPDRMPCYHDFDVSPATGAVRYSSMGSDPRSVAADPRLMAAVVAACR